MTTKCKRFVGIALMVLSGLWISTCIMYSSPGMMIPVAIPISVGFVFFGLT